ncbi:GCD complex subunit gcd7 [Vanrija albida]|uniref:Translation initiation factor eIF2B subunit beta n=1 Tax=Vanrija albida TaxID=181172 RepID=A0ABR3QCY5_9TREE
MAAEAGLTEASNKLVDALVVRLRRRQIVGSRNVALATIALIQNIVRSVKYNTIDELLAIIRDVGRRLVEANPKELAAGNIVRRSMKLIREEYRAAAQARLSQPPSIPGTPYVGPGTPGFVTPPTQYFSIATAASAAAEQTARGTGTSSGRASSSIPSTPVITRQASLSNFVAMRHSRVQLERSGLERQGSVLDFSASTNSLFATPPGHRGSRSGPSGAEAEDRAEWEAQQAKESAEFARQAGRLKPVLIQAIEEVVNEVETTHEDVARGAKEHIHSSEVILTLGHSRTVEAFLKQAFRDRKFTVIVLESAPSFLGQAMAGNLATAGIPTILVPDSSLHAVMPRVTKVILGAHSVSANGGLFALAGSLAAVLAAKTHAKPVVVTTGQFKFAPVWNLYHEYDALDFQGPGPVIGYDHTGGGGGFEGVEVSDPHYDYIRPELINLYATNVGDHPPSYIYRIIKEAYDDEDIEL